MLRKLREARHETQAMAGFFAHRLPMDPRVPLLGWDLLQKSGSAQILEAIEENK